MSWGRQGLLVCLEELSPRQCVPAAWKSPRWPYNFNTWWNTLLLCVWKEVIECSQMWKELTWKCTQGWTLGKVAHLPAESLLHFPSFSLPFLLTPLDINLWERCSSNYTLFTALGFWFCSGGGGSEMAFTAIEHLAHLVWEGLVLGIACGIESIVQWSVQLLTQWPAENQSS